MLNPDAASLVVRHLQLPVHPGRKGEGGLRTRGLYKSSCPGKPLVTILTVVLNSARFLEETIVSVLNQDYDNIEFIVIDGGSRDGTVDVIRKYEDAIDYWVSEPDKGISDAFNKAVMLASGDYLNFQGAGDYLVAGNVVSEMMRGVDSARDMLICGRVQRVTETAERKVLWVSPKHYTPHFDKRSFLRRMPLPHQALFTHRKMFDRYGLFDTDVIFTMDYEHLLRAYHDFPRVTLKDIQFAAWREGGIATGRSSEWLREQSRIKRKNKVAPVFVLALLDIYIYSVRRIKMLLGLVK